MSEYYNDYQEAMQIVHDDERNADRERNQERVENFRLDENETTTYERAQYNEEVEQDIYERDDKMGAIWK